MPWTKPIMNPIINRIEVINIAALPVAIPAIAMPLPVGFLTPTIPSTKATTPAIKPIAKNDVSTENIPVTIEAMASPLVWFAAGC